MTPTPVLHLLAGPNGAGKSTFHERLLGPVTGLELVNADQIAAARWPGDELRHAYEASRLAAEERLRRLDAGRSFVAETVFSHPSKIELVAEAQQRGYLVTLHVMMISVEQAVRRVEDRVLHGGHDVPEDKIRDRHARLWAMVRVAVDLADETFVYDNSVADRPFRLVATYRRGLRHVEDAPPAWMPPELAR